MNGTGDSDEVVRTVTARLPSGVAVKVEAVTDGASADGMTSVGLRHFEMADALESVGEIGALVVSKLGKAKPSKTTVELKLGFAVEAGKLTALWVGGKGEAALTVTLEWSGRRDTEAGPGEAGAVRSGEGDGGGCDSCAGDGPAAGNADG
jgi:Trypsin-co-occurring domain 1